MKKIVSLVLALALVLGLCSFATAEGAAKKVGIAMPTQSLERWNRDGAYLKEQFEAAGYEVILTFSDNDNDKQVNDINNMLSQDVDMLIISCIDSAGLNTALDVAAEKGVPVIAYDRMIENDAVSYYVSFDNYTVGVLPWIWKMLATRPSTWNSPAAPPPIRMLAISSAALMTS